VKSAPAQPITLTRESVDALCLTLEKGAGTLEPTLALPFVVTERINVQIAKLVSSDAVASIAGRFILIHHRIEFRAPISFGSMVDVVSRVDCVRSLGSKLIMRLVATVGGGTSPNAICTFDLECGVAGPGEPLPPYGDVSGVRRTDLVASTSCVVSSEMHSRWARFAGDPNRIHTDRDAAAGAGYPDPPLHGVCSLALVLFAAGAVRGINFEDVVSVSASFLRPVYARDRIAINVYATRTPGCLVLCARTPSGLALRVIVTS
jgi:hypothetical protein